VVLGFWLSVSGNSKEPLAKSDSIPSGFSQGITVAIESWNRLNGFCLASIFFDKPLKRLNIFQGAFNPKLKLGENETFFSRGSKAKIKNQRPKTQGQRPP